MQERVYVAELTDPVTQEVIVLEATTEEELDAKIAAAAPDAEPLHDILGPTPASQVSA